MLLRALHTTTTGKRRVPLLGAIVVLGVLLPLLSGCRLVGRGTLGYVPGSSAYSLAATEGSTVSVLVFRHEEGDVWPPAGKLGLLVSAENLLPPARGYDLRPVTFWEDHAGSRTRAGSCDELNARGGMAAWAPGGAPVVRVREDGTMQEWLTVDDTVAFWENPYWALTEESSGEVPAIAFRCGTISVVQ